MSELKFSKCAAREGNPGWEKLISRQSELYSRRDDVRSPFARDYTRILHSMAYRRLKHKTQVFFNIGVVTGLIPNTGISLPFFRYGGTALMIHLAEMGMILSISRQIPAPRKD